MSEQNQTPPKKILESSPMSGIAVPIAIVLVGALIIFGVTKMLSSGKNHRDLIDEMNSKTFGNRWVAAYELSKFLAGNKIPKEDIPWVIENLISVYETSADANTRNFVVVALGSLNNPLCVDLLNKALKDPDPKTRFNAIAALGNMPKGTPIDWVEMEHLVKQTDDIGAKHAALLTLASHDFAGVEQFAQSLLQYSEKTVRYAAATVLIKYKKEEALPTLNEIMSLRYDVAQAGEFNGAQVEGLKINVLSFIEKYQWKEMTDWVSQIEKNDTNVKVATKAKQVVNVLKN